MLQKSKIIRYALLMLSVASLSVLSSQVRTSEARAQGIQSNPLTRLGYGSLESQSPVAWRGMGGVGIAMSSNKVINMQNPAAYGATDSLSFLLDIGASVNMGHYRDGIGKKTTLMGGLDYLALQFPLYKDRIAFSTGVVPFSNVGYGLVSDIEIEGRETVNLMRQTFDGTGSLQSFYFGLGSRIWGGLYFGVNARYYFGSIVHSVHLVPSSTLLAQTFTQNTIRLDDWGVDLGLQYKFTLPGKRKDQLTLGVTYTPQMALRPKMTFFENQNFGSTTRPEITEKSLKPTTQIPHKIGAGLAWNVPDKMTVAADFETQLWSGATNIFENDAVTFQDSYRGALGIEFLPDVYSRRYYNRMYYRLGVNYESSYMSVTPVGQMHSVGASFGLGMPVNMFSNDRTSIINLTLEYNRDFSTVQKGVSVDVLKLSLSLNFNETWFRKLKIY